MTNTKKAAQFWQELDGSAPKEGTGFMIETTADTASTRTELQSVRRDLAEARHWVEALKSHEQAVMENAVTALARKGVSVRLVQQNRTQPLRVGELVWLCDHYVLDNDGVTHGVNIIRLDDRRSKAPARPVVTDGYWSTYFTIHRGVYEVFASTDEHQLFVKIEDARDNSERGRRLAVGQLRRLAKAEDLRVQTRDQEVSLVDPMGAVIHLGTLETAYCWLLNVDIEMATER